MRTRALPRFDTSRWTTAQQTRADQQKQLPLVQPDGLALSAFTAEPGSPSADALNLLASWAASSTENAPTPDRPGRTAAS